MLTRGRFCISHSGGKAAITPVMECHFCRWSGRITHREFWLLLRYIVNEHIGNENIVDEKKVTEMMANIDNDTGYIDVNKDLAS